MTAHIAYYVFLRRSAKNMAAKFKGRAKKHAYFIYFIADFNLKMLSQPIRRMPIYERCITAKTA